MRHNLDQLYWTPIYVIFANIGRMSLFSRQRILLFVVVMRLQNYAILLRKIKTCSSNSKQRMTRPLQSFPVIRVPMADWS
mmetsp:Transcript_127417/g.366439  ORF Transcript_127417/g.366439 Transcript_127417/m.366439 type:complete len:80 (+) Transcript_127417:77-316(+)